MEKFLLVVTAMMALTLLGGCSKSQDNPPTTPEPPTASTEPATTPAESNSPLCRNGSYSAHHAPDYRTRRRCFVRSR